LESKLANKNKMLWICINESKRKCPRGRQNSRSEHQIKNVFTERKDIYRNWGVRVV
jgi:hypothetical protein